MESCSIFHRVSIAARDDSLDITWLKDDSETADGELPEPDLLAREALEELAGAMNELQAILVELGAEEEEAEEEEVDEAESESGGTAPGSSDWRALRLTRSEVLALIRPPLRSRLPPGQL